MAAVLACQVGPPHHDRDHPIAVTDGGGIDTMAGFLGEPGFQPIHRRVMLQNRVPAGLGDAIEGVALQFGDVQDFRLIGQDRLGSAWRHPWRWCAKPGPAGR